MGKGLRASIGINDKRNYNSSFSTPGFQHNDSFQPVSTTADAIGVYTYFKESLQQFSELTRAMEIENLKNSLEATMPKGEEATLAVSGYQSNKGFDNVGVYPAGQEILGSDDRQSLQRPETVTLIGKGNPDFVNSGVSVKPPGVNNTRGVDFIPSSQRTEYTSHDGLRIEGRRTDSMDRQEREFFDHPDRSLA